jgi:hypothetical protein
MKLNPETPTLQHPLARYNHGRHDHAGYGQRINITSNSYPNTAGTAVPNHYYWASSAPPHLKAPKKEQGNRRRDVWPAACAKAGTGHNIEESSSYAPTPPQFN